MIEASQRSAPRGPGSALSCAQIGFRTRTKPKVSHGKPVRGAADCRKRQSGLLIPLSAGPADILYILDPWMAASSVGEMVVDQSRCGGIIWNLKFSDTSCSRVLH